VLQSTHPKDDDRRGALRNAQKEIGKAIRDKEESTAEKKTESTSN
jgi:hypothetical protein